LGETGGALAARLYLQPENLIAGSAAIAMVEAGLARPLAGGPIAFSAARMLVREADGTNAYFLPLAQLTGWAEAEDPAVAAYIAAGLDRLTAPRLPFAGLVMDRPCLMGVINVTPDSFSDGGQFLDAPAAIAHGKALAAAGAAILDIGGESTRPGAEPVAVEEEIRRVVPVVAALADAGVLISIDTRRAPVMRAALAAGAHIVNDVTALAGDPESLDVVAASDAAVVLMHMRGEPRTMQQTPRYRHAPADLFDFFAARIEACVAAGIDVVRIAADPGIGFGKTVTHNLELLESLALLHGLGVPLVLGVSRKRFIGMLSADEPAEERTPGSIAAGIAGLERGIQILRVHDVAETRQALTIWRALVDPWKDGLGASV
jgi:dihydropteroate synthase